MTTQKQNIPYGLNKGENVDQIGAMLQEKQEDDMIKPPRYFSKTLKATEWNEDTT